MSFITKLREKVMVVVNSIKRGRFVYDTWKYFFINRRLFALLNVFVPFIKIRRNKIVFSSFYGRDYGCNPKYIAEELLRLNTDCEMVWLIDKKKTEGRHHVPPAIKTVEYLSPQAFYELAQAAVWVNNCRWEFYPRKRKGQVYFQTWHGNIALKKIEKDVENKLSKLYVRQAHNDAVLTDYCVSNGAQITSVYQRAFWYDMGKVTILEYGTPRNDILVNSKDWTAVREKFALPPDTRIVLYAPTFRADKNLDGYQLDYMKIIEALEKKFACRYVGMVRLHHNLILRLNDLELPEGVMNVTSWPDVQELLGITDILISDYSSIMFDFMFTRRPCFIYATDFEEYKKDRNVYFPLEASPFSIAGDNEELSRNIAAFDEKQYHAGIDVFLKRFGCFEQGDAAMRVAAKIVSVIEKGKE